MKKKTLWKDIQKCFLKSKGRFFSIVCLIMLGSFALVGLQVSGPDMRQTGFHYFEKMNLADMTIIGDYGIDKENQNAINRISGTTAIEYGYMKDMVIRDTTTSFRAFSKTEGLSDYELLSGRMPVSNNEIAIAGFWQDEYAIGDMIIFDEKEDISGNLVMTNHEFTIVGFVNSGELLSSKNLGPSTAGTGALKGYAVVTPSAFDSDVYMIVRVSFEDTKGVDPYSDEYVQLLQNHKDELSLLLNDQPTKRLMAIKADAQQKVDDGWAELADAKQELADIEAELEDARIAIEDARLEIADGEEKIADAKIGLANAQAELDDASGALKDGRKELEDGRTELNEKIEELEDAAKKIANAEIEIDDKRDLLKEKRQEYNDGLAELDDARREIADGERKIANAQAVLNQAKRDLDAAPAALEAGRRELANGKAELVEKEQELAAAEKEIAAGEKALAENAALLKEKQQQYDDAAAPIEKARNEYAAAEGRYKAAEKEINDGEAALSAGKAQYESGISALEQGKVSLEALLSNPDLPPELQSEYIQQLNEVNIELDQTKSAYQSFLDGEYAIGMAGIETGRRELADQKVLLDASDREISSKESELAAAKIELDSGYALYNQAEAKLSAAKVQTSDGKKQIEDGKKKLIGPEQLLATKQDEYVSGLITYQSGLSELSSAKYDLKLAKIQLKAGEDKLDDAKKQLDDGYNQLKDAEKELSDAKIEYKDGYQKIEDAKVTLAENEELLAEKEAEYADGVVKYQNAQTEFAEKSQELADSKEEFAEKEGEYQNALAEYEEEKLKADQDIADAEEELADTQASIDALEVPVYALDTRREIPGSEGYRIYNNISSIVDALADVFPIFLYFVAALVTLTTMTRFVDEERINCGTLKALGYKDRDVIKKFVVYGTVSSVLGSIIGITAGHLLLPAIVHNAYRDAFTFPQIELHFYPQIAAIALILSLISTVVPAFFVSLNNLRTKPSALLQPKPPASGAKILLERIRPLWNRMSFTHKVTARNIFRYKKRMLMTIFGVCGSVTLLFAGLSVQHSIAGINNRQFGEILQYDMIVAKKSFLLERQAEEIEALIASDEIDQYIHVRYEEMTKVAGKKQDKQNIQMIIPEDDEAFRAYVQLANSSGGDELNLTDDGVILTERFAKLLGAKPGDTITLTDSKGQEWEMKVSGIAEMYIGHFAFMSDAYYQTVFGKVYQPNAEMIKLVDSGVDNVNIRSNEFMQLDGIIGVSQGTTQKTKVDLIVASLNKIMNVLVIVSALLAIVILYNLTNINVSERIRELSTIKVLGFHSKEVTMYIYRETIILTMLGILAGFLGGDIFYRYILDVVPPEEVMFNPALGTLAFIVPFLTVGVISAVLGMFINHRLKNVDMLEALKSVE